MMGKSLMIRYPFELEKVKTETKLTTSYYRTHFFNFEVCRPENFMYINKMEAMYGQLRINEKSNLAQSLLFLCSHTWLLYYLCN